MHEGCAANARVVNNWRNPRFRGSNYAAFYNYNRQWHDRGWWRNHHSRIVFVLGGWWYWNAGYWYPAWGYDSNAYYPYDGPIYGYGELAPDRIIVNVQVALQRDGYYAGPTDGILGSQTREALAAFQADHGLTVTSAVDGPTLQTLGLAEYWASCRRGAARRTRCAALLLTNLREQKNVKARLHFGGRASRK